MNRRTYQSKTRNAQAAQTRIRILDCARRLFQSEGFEFVTIEKLAQAAEVAAPTIYSLFRSKRGVLRALMDEALPADQFEALVEEALQETSPKAHLAISAKIARRMYDAERAQMDIFQGAAVLAPEFKALEKEREERRYKRQEVTINMLKGSLLEGLSEERARDILWAFTGRDMYRMFIVERGWTSDEYEKWLADLLVKSLLDEHPKRFSGRQP